MPQDVTRYVAIMEGTRPGTSHPVHVTSHPKVVAAVEEAVREVLEEDPSASVDLIRETMDAAKGGGTQ